VNICEKRRLSHFACICSPRLFLSFETPVSASLRKATKLSLDRYKGRRMQVASFASLERGPDEGRSQCLPRDGLSDTSARECTPFAQHYYSPLTGNVTLHQVLEIG
jgi:hypothetical protein